MAKPPAKTSKSCFFITPIGAPDSVERRRADWIFHHVIEPVAESLKLDAERADLMSGSAMISTNIFKAISEAPVCVADLTGLNPNVFYEIGVRHSLKMPIVHLAQVGTALPFDTAPHLTHFYDLADYNSMATLKDFLSKEMKLVTEDDYTVSNPFTHALGNIEISRSGDPKDQVILRMEERIRNLEAKTPQEFPARPHNTKLYQLLNDLIASNLKNNLEFSLSEGFMQQAVDSIPSNDLDTATDTYFSSHSKRFLNRDLLKQMLRERFPEIPHY